jgi:hypothetical protein
MRNLNNITVIVILILATAGNASICSGKEPPFCLSCVDSIPRSKDGIIDPSMLYMYVQEKLDGTCHLAYDEILRIHYEEPYAVPDYQRLRFRIYDKYRNLLVETDETGSVGNTGCADTLSPRIQIGENWLIIDLTCLGLEEDYYYLEVWNGKGEMSYLRFKCSPANSAPRNSKKR